MNKEQILKIFKNKNNMTICLIFIIGVVLMVCASSLGGERKDTPQSRTATEEAYAESEEKRLADILSKIEGAGEVSVMITYYSGAEKNLAYETKTSQRNDGNEISEDKKAVTSGGEPMVVKEVYPRVKGVIIAAEGADIPSVRSVIYEAALSTLDVSAHRICIFKKEEE